MSSEQSVVCLVSHFIYFRDSCLDQSACDLVTVVKVTVQKRLKEAGLWEHFNGHTAKVKVKTANSEGKK